jgi:hypothetical protein
LRISRIEAETCQQTFSESEAELGFDKELEIEFQRGLTWLDPNESEFESVMAVSENLNNGPDSSKKMLIRNLCLEGLTPS